MVAEATSQSPLRWVLASAGAILGPFVLMSVYLLLAEVAGERLPNLYLPALCLSVLGGVLCVLMLPTGPGLREAMVIVYVPLYAALLFVYSLFFVCAVFGDCL